jgi:hypothetical protein
MLYKNMLHTTCKKPCQSRKSTSLIKYYKYWFKKIEHKVMKAYFQFYFCFGCFSFDCLACNLLFESESTQHIPFDQKVKKLVEFKNLMLLDQILLHLQLDQKHKI